MVKTAVVDEVLGASGLTLPDDAIDSAKEAVSALIERASSQENGASKVDRRLVDAAIEELDQKISEQMDAVMHHESFQAIEKAWRQLDFLVSRTNFKENIKI
ncbi:MAG: type VI secretion system contractile sheath large subunit, partial [Acidiferrobacteraceae bacterium]|nr:type VI secretion system contractile sheath large subunit [Acidiferrobacteraceae bacterium]